MKTCSLGRGGRIVQISLASFSMAILIGVGGGVSAQTVTVSPTPSTWCSSQQKGPPPNMFYLCVDQEPAQAPPGSSSITWNLSSPPGCAFPLGQGGIIVDKVNKKKTTGNQSWNVTTASASSYTAAPSTGKDHKKYAYTINVICGGYLLTYDPTIQN
jgi:hypothetical protein